MQVAMGHSRAGALTECSSTRPAAAQHQPSRLQRLSSLRHFSPATRASSAAPAQRQARRALTVATYPEPETEKERSPIDFPQVRNAPEESGAASKRGRPAYMALGPAPHACLCRPQSTLQEWITPAPSRRPDIFPEFEKLETPMPKPLPGDPEVRAGRRPHYAALGGGGREEGQDCSASF